MKLNPLILPCFLIILYIMLMPCPFVFNWPYQMAAAVMAVVPVIMLFVFSQRYFVRGIQMTGFK